MLGNELRPLKIDISSVQHMRGRYARIYVEMELNKPLRTYIRFGKRLCRLEYERLNQICFDYGCFGHNKEACAKNALTMPKDQMATETETGYGGNTEDEQGKLKLPKLDPWMQVPM